MLQVWKAWVSMLHLTIVVFHFIVHFGSRNTCEPNWLVVRSYLRLLRALVVLAPGVDVAVHTYEPLLATAAWLDTAQHLRALMAAGQTVAAWRIFASVVEIRHAPAGPVLSSTIPGLPPFRRVPCVAADCARCREGRGGFQFPFVGLWTRRGVFPPPDANGAEAWERLARWLATETCDLLSLEAVRSGISVLEICPTHVGCLVEAVEAGDGHQHQ